MSQLWQSLYYICIGICACTLKDVLVYALYVGLIVNTLIETQHRNLSTNSQVYYCRHPYWITANAVEG